MTKNKESIGWGVSSLVTGLVGILMVFAPYFGLPLSIVAIVSSIKQKPNSGLSTAGLVLGILGVIFNSLTSLFLIIALIIGTGF